MRIVAGAPPTTVAEGAPAAVGNTSTAGAIQEKIDLSQLYFYDAFQMHMEHGKDNVGGRLTLGFTITPNGAVKECHVTANNFAGHDVREHDAQRLSALPVRTGQRP